MSTIAQAASRADQLEISLPKGLVIAGLVAALYGPLQTQMVVQWWKDPDYSHGFVVPLFVGYVLYQRKHKLQHIQLEPNNFGFPLMLGAFGLLLAGSLGAELFVARFSLLNSLSAPAARSFCARRSPIPSASKGRPFSRALTISRPSVEITSPRIMSSPDSIEAYPAIGV